MLLQVANSTDNERATVLLNEELIS